MESNKLDTIDIIHDDVYDKIENVLSIDLPPLFFGDSSIGIYEYWGSKEVDPPHPYIEIDEEERIIDIDIDYPISDIKEAIDNINKNFIYHIIDDYWGLRYNYKIKEIIINDDGSLKIMIKWLNVTN
jgi:hypothetical protein